MNITKILETYLPDTPVARYEFVGYEHKIESMHDYFEASMDLLKEDVQDMLFNSAIHTTHRFYFPLLSLNPMIITFSGQAAAHLPQRMHSAESGFATGSTSIGQTDAHLPQDMQPLLSIRTR